MSLKYFELQTNQIYLEEIKELRNEAEQLRINAQATKAYTEQLEVKFKQAEQIEADFAKIPKLTRENDVMKKKLETLSSKYILLFVHLSLLSFIII